tara:strand:+ start:17812 stop:18060 length:249 start_codon:yes stop_codon:yes gene_type:complete
MMSRYEIGMTLDTNEHTFAYGYDRPMQTYFWQVFDDEGETLVDEGGMTPRSGGQLLEAIDKYGVKDLVKEDHMVNAAMDMPF